MSTFRPLILAVSAAAVLSATAAQAESLRSYDADRYNYGPVAAQPARPATPQFNHVPASARGTFSAPVRTFVPGSPAVRPDSARPGSDR